MTISLSMTMTITVQSTIAFGSARITLWL